jgi:hypothetical protein
MPCVAKERLIASCVSKICNLLVADKIQYLIVNFRCTYCLITSRLASCDMQGTSTRSQSYQIS